VVEMGEVAEKGEKRRIEPWTESDRDQDFVGEAR